MKAPRCRLGRIGGMGLLPSLVGGRRSMHMMRIRHAVPFCDWTPRADENDLCGWRPCANEHDANQASMHALGCLLGLIGSFGLLPLFGWRPWVDDDDENQVCKLPVASASCPIGGWRLWVDGPDENQVR